MLTRIALPSSDALGAATDLMMASGCHIQDPSPASREYAVRCNLPDILIKTFHEEDIPWLVSEGYYDAGICGSDWLEEYYLSEPSATKLEVTSGAKVLGSLCLLSTTAESNDLGECTTLVTNYPNLARQYADRYFPASRVRTVAGAIPVYLMHHAHYGVTRVSSCSRIGVTYQVRPLFTVKLCLAIQTGSVKPDIVTILRETFLRSLAAS